MILDATTKYPCIIHYCLILCPSFFALLGLALVDLRDLHADILRLIQLGVNLDYWIPLKLLCEREIAVADERRRSHGSLSLEQVCIPIFYQYKYFIYPYFLFYTNMGFVIFDYLL